MVEVSWCNNYTNISLTGNSVLLLINNEATQSGGAGYFDFYCNFTIKGNVNVTFDNNKALHCGAVCFNNNANKYLKKICSILLQKLCHCQYRSG